jgi:hypothetical protein
MLVLSTILKNIRQWEAISHALLKIKNVPNHQPGNMLKPLVKATEKFGVLTVQQAVETAVETG